MNHLIINALVKWSHDLYKLTHNNKKTGIWGHEQRVNFEFLINLEKSLKFVGYILYNYFAQTIMDPDKHHYKLKYNNSWNKRNNR